MAKQNEQKIISASKRPGLLAAVTGLLFVAICVSVALLASILKGHASIDEGVIALVPEVIVQEELLVSNETSYEDTKAEAESVIFENKGTSQSNTNKTEEIVIDENSLVVQGSSNVPSMEMEVTYRDEVITVPLNPSMQVYDDKKVWETNTEVDIFKIQYENDEAKVTVNGNTDKVIAPGTDNAYTFYLKNTGDVNLDYTLNMEAYFTPADVHIPVEVKLKGYDGNYLVGDQNNWADALELNDIEDKASIDINRYAYYTLEWQWPFERGDDEFDTYLGNRAVDEDLKLTIVIKTIATGDDSRTEVIRVPIISWIPGIPKTGDVSNVLLWGGLLAASMVVLVICLIVMKRGKKSSEEMEEINEEN